VGVDVTASIQEALASVVRNSTNVRLHDRVRAELGLPFERTSYTILRHAADGPGRLSDLAAALQVDISTASRQVRSLEDAGLLVRSSHPSDGRASVLELTDAGRDALDGARAAWRRVVEEILSGWTIADRRALAPLLQRLADDIASYTQA
jgi:DNA-binding MarR family transcriptional regulator